MFAYVGLGNPGSTYASNRHNIGFMVLDVLADRYNAPPWKAGFGGHITEIHHDGQKFILCKPQTFMNLSGKCVQRLIQFYKLASPQVYTFHDDLDLAPGKVRVKRGGSNGGHNGLESMSQHISADFWRVRLGIGRPSRKDQVIPYVLGNFSREEEEWVVPLLDAIACEGLFLPSYEDPGQWLTKLYKHFSLP